MIEGEQMDLEELIAELERQENAGEIDPEEADHGCGC